MSDSSHSHLPILELTEKIHRALEQKNRLILQAPTGSGKSSQIPQILLTAPSPPKGQIIILQPRRLPARMLAKRVATEQKVALGETVGYQIRFENRTSPRTRINFVTEAILLRKLLTDPAISHISTVILDEFHERHIHTDICLATLKKLQETTRPDLRLIIMSATLDTAELEKYLAPHATTLTSSTRTYPVKTHYLPKPPSPKTSISELAARTVESALQNDLPGDILIFMPGAFEINQTIRALQHQPLTRNTTILPLHGELPPDKQDIALSSSSERKIIVSTNVAETSLTIPGIRIVIDSGLARIPTHDHSRGINTLLIRTISQASAEQRTGRAGRTAPGECFRLWTQAQHANRPPRETPEIHRLDLTETALTLKGLQITDLTTFPWLETPPTPALQAALNLLKNLGAITTPSSPLTARGSQMLHFPIHPRHAALLIAAHERNCLPEACLIAALTQSRDILIRTSDKKIKDRRLDLWEGETHSDLFALMKAFHHASTHRFHRESCQPLGIHAQASREVARTYQQLRTISESVFKKPPKNQPEDDLSTALRKSILLSFSDHLAVRQSPSSLRCRLTENRYAEIPPDSLIKNSDLIIATRITEKENHRKNAPGQPHLKTHLHTLTHIEESWLQDFFPEDFSKTTDHHYDSHSRKILITHSTTFRDIPIHTSSTDAPPSDSTAELLAEQITSGNITLKHWNHHTEQWIIRLNCLASWCPELQLPPIDPEGRHAIITQICLGSSSYKQLKDKEVMPTLKSWLSPPQRQTLDSYAPERLRLTEKRSAKIHYTPDSPPKISATIQDLYDHKTTLTVAHGKIPLLIEVLAPNRRPVQLTENLENFWKNTYHTIKPELQRRYPKHLWR